MSTEDQQQMDFDTAFTEATQPEASAPPVEQETEVVAAPAPESVVAPEAAPAPTVETEVVAAEKPAEPAPAPMPSHDSSSEELARLRRELEEERAKRVTPPAPEPEAEPAAQQPAPEAKAILSAAEQARVDEYKNDWPDVAEAESLLRKEMAESLKAEVYSAVGMVFQQFYQMVAPMLTDHKETSVTKRDKAISEKIGDYQQIKGSLADWASAQPSVVSKAYKEILDSGSIDDVIKVVSLYKQAVGQTTPQTTLPTTQTPASAPALELVQSGRRTTPVTSEPSKDDFAGGWADALRTVRK